MKQLFKILFLLFIISFINICKGKTSTCKEATLKKALAVNQVGVENKKTESYESYLIDNYILNDLKDLNGIKNFDNENNFIFSLDLFLPFNSFTTLIKLIDHEQNLYCCIHFHLKPTYEINLLTTQNLKGTITG